LVEGEMIEYGQPYARAIDLDDWVHDTEARTWDEISFCGHRYRVPFDQAQAFEGFDAELRKKLKPTHCGYQDENSERVERIGKGDPPERDGELKAFVELWDLWIPGDNTIVTLAAHSKEMPLRTIQYEGPEGGPYHLLRFLDVPNNVMPVAPTAHWLDLHRLINSLMRKLGRQARREKQVMLVHSSAKDDATRIRDASDGEIIKSDNPQGAKEARFGGPDQPTMLFTTQIRMLASQLMGNIDVMGGLSSEAETLGQEELLKKSSSSQVGEMQDRVVEFTREVINSLGWWLWHDPVIEVPLTKEIAGTDIRIPTTFSPEDREGDFLDYNISIDPISMQDTSPAQKMQIMDMFIQQIPQVAQAAMVMMQSGQGNLNVEEFFRLKAKYANFKDLERLLQFAMPTPPIQPGIVQPQAENPMKPATTTRIEKRISKPGASRKGTDSIFAQMMANMGGVQQSEANVLSGAS